jgi:hypothetical protein
MISILRPCAGLPCSSISPRQVSLSTRRLTAFGAIFNQTDQREVIAAAIADTSSLKRGRSKFFELEGIGLQSLGFRVERAALREKQDRRGKFVLARPRVRSMRLSVVGSSGPAPTNVER